MRTMLRGRARAWVVGAVALASAMGAPLVAASSAEAATGDLTTDLVGWWKLDETTGTTAADSSGNGRAGTVTGAATWNGGDGFVFSGGANSSGNAIRLPGNLLAGVDDVTVDLDVWVDPSLSGNWFMFNLGNTATYPNGTGYLFVTNDAQGRYRGTIAENGFATEQSASRPGGLKTGVWKHVTFSIDGGTPAAPGSSRLYEDGVLAAANTNLTTSPQLLGTPDGTTTLNVLGRSAYGGDVSFKGRLRDVRIYSRALTANEAATRAESTSTAAADADTTALSLGDTSAVTGNLTLPTSGANGSTVTWATSNAGVVTASGAVTRPAYKQPDATATLTATITRGAVSRTKTFAITVKAESIDAQGKAQADVDALALVHPDDVRGNLTLPTTGTVWGSPVTWSSAQPSVVSATGVVTRPSYGQAAVDVVLTATATQGSATASRAITVRVQPLPAPAAKEGYAFAYFAGESTDDGEKIYFGASKGDDPLDYDVLNAGRPVLESTFGTKGLRDPFILRSHEGDRFYLLATDLKAYPAVDFGEAQETGSKYMEIWESTDLVHWGAQRHVKVSSDFAGNTWAPEAFYDEKAGEYVVYWASALYPTTSTAGRDINTQYQRMMYATTRDFVTFSDPKPWIDVKRGTGRGIIDATVVKDGDTFYRVIKDEASMTPRQEKSTDLRATVTGSLATTTSTPGWQLVKEQLGVGQPNPWGGTFTNGEGPTVFQDNHDPDRWYMFIDQPSYHGGRGYLAFQTDDLAHADWHSVPTAQLPSSPRHGTVLPVSQAELDALRAAYQPDLLISSTQDVAVRTRQGTAPALPATVPATYGDGTTGPTPVTWAPVDAASWAQPGTFTVQGTVERGSADDPVATVTVTDRLDPVVALSSRADGAAGWWTTDPATVAVSATDETGVASLATSLDGAAPVTTSGGSTTLTVAGDGTHTVTATALDTTGNTSSLGSLTVRVDATDPVSRADVAGREVTVRGADATSGVARLETKVGDGAWTPYTGPVTVGAAGASVAYRAVDVAGNVEPANTVVVALADAPQQASVLVATAPGAAKAGERVPVTARVNGPGAPATGTVRVLSGGTLLGSGTLVDGRVTSLVDTAALGVGTHRLTVRYDGDARHAAAEDTVELRVAAATSTTSLRVTRGGKAVVRVTTDPAAALPSTVTVTLVRGGRTLRTHVVRLDGGAGAWKLPALVGRKRPVKVVATVATTPTLVGSADRARLR